MKNAAWVMARAPVPVHVQADEATGVRKVTGLSAGDLVTHAGGDALELGGVRVRLLHTPGHTPGSQCFLVEQAGAPGRLVSGDTLFLGS
jgi:hydroxyacylglutathione hydrolase